MADLRFTCRPQQASVKTHAEATKQRVPRWALSGPDGDRVGGRRDRYELGAAWRGQSGARAALAGLTFAARTHRGERGGTTLNRDVAREARALLPGDQLKAILLVEVEATEASGLTICDVRPLSKLPFFEDGLDRKPYRVLTPDLPGFDQRA